MISVKEYANVRLEVEFKVLAGSISILEDNFGRMPLSQFLEVWGPEIQDSQVMVKLVFKENNNNGTRKDGSKS